MEEAVAFVLRKHGYEILERNFRVRQGEIDIVAKDGETLTFVEVKYRSKNAQGDGFDAVDYKKQRQLSKVALYYMSFNDIGDDVGVRFDVAYVDDEKVRVMKNAFAFSFDSHL